MAVNKSKRRARPVTAQQVKKMIYGAAETKHHTLSYDDEPMSTGGDIIALSDINHGTGDQHRIGDQIRVQKIYGQLVVKMATTLTGTNNYNKMFPAFRFLILQSKKSGPAVGDIPANYYDPVDVDKFYVLQDKLISLNNPMSINDGTNTYYLAGPNKLKINMKKLNNNLIQYNGNNAEPVRNEIFMAFIPQNNDVGGTALPFTYSGFVQMYYKDL